MVSLLGCNLFLHRSQYSQGMVLSSHSPPLPRLAIAPTVRGANLSRGQTV